jgi:hypothetical protein
MRGVIAAKSSKSPADNNVTKLLIAQWPDAHRINRQ